MVPMNHLSTYQRGHPERRLKEPAVGNQGGARCIGPPSRAYPYVYTSKSMYLLVVCAMGGCRWGCVSIGSKAYLVVECPPIMGVPYCMEVEYEHLYGGRHKKSPM